MVNPEAIKGTGDQRRLWSDCAESQADLSLRWSHKSYCRFCLAVAHIQTCSDGMTNSVYLDQTASVLRNSLIWVFIVCSSLNVQIFGEYTGNRFLRDVPLFFIIPHKQARSN